MSCQKFLVNGRLLQMDELSEIRMDVMPGFKLNWFYTGADDKFLQEPIVDNSQFVR